MNDTFLELKAQLPPGYSVAHLLVGSVIPIAPDGTVVAGDAYHGFFMKDAVELAKQHYRRRGLEGVL